nr:hypothetical protein [uncultured Hyphomonas sp.]
MNLRNTLERAMARSSLRFALRSRTPLYDPAFPAVVMWSEKSACTVAVKWFFHHIGRLDEAMARHIWVHVWENEVFKAAPGYIEACAGAIRDGRPVIKFVRNPYTRAFSGFLETCHPRTLTEPEHWSAVTRAAVVRHVFGADADVATPYSFNQFADWMRAQPVRTLDYHLAPQYLDVEARFDVQNIRLEDHENAFLYAEAQLGLPSTRDEKQLYRSGHHHAKEPVSGEEAVAALDTPLPPDRPFRSSVADPPAEVIARSPAGEVIRKVCAADFSAYGYTLKDRRPAD